MYITILSVRSNWCLEQHNNAFRLSGKPGMDSDIRWLDPLLLIYERTCNT